MHSKNRACEWVLVGKRLEQMTEVHLLETAILYHLLETAITLRLRCLKDHRQAFN